MARVLHTRSYFNSIAVCEADDGRRTITKTTGGGVEQRRAIEQAAKLAEENKSLTEIRALLEQADFVVHLEEGQQGSDSVSLGPGGWGDFYFYDNYGIGNVEATIRCPRCTGRARWEAHSFYGYIGYPVEDTRSRRKGRTSPKAHMVKCTQCFYVNAYYPKLPDELYYQWNIHGHILWAWNIGHARVLLAFLSSKERDETQYPGYQRSLRKLPAAILSAKVRDDVVRAMKKTEGL